MWRSFQSRTTFLHVAMGDTRLDFEEWLRRTRGAAGEVSEVDGADDHDALHAWIEAECDVEKTGWAAELADRVVVCPSNPN
jgi:hypothetical protein